MAEGMTATAVSAPLPQTSRLSQTRDALVSLRATSLTTTATRSFAIGTASAAPATFGAYDGTPVAGRIDEGSPSLFQPATGGGTNVSMSISLSAGTLASMTAGEHVFVTLYGVATPVSGSVPQFVADCGVLNAS